MPDTSLISPVTVGLGGGLILDKDDFLRIEDAHIILEEGDILKAQAGAANDLEVTAFIEERYKPQG